MNKLKSKKEEKAEELYSEPYTTDLDDEEQLIGEEQSKAEKVFKKLKDNMPDQRE